MKKALKQQALHIELRRLRKLGDSALRRNDLETFRRTYLEYQAVKDKIKSDAAGRRKPEYIGMKSHRNLPGSYGSGKRR